MQRIEQAFTKDQILELYLNEIFLGLNSYGIAAASLNYFGKSLDELDLDEMAYLAALAQGPQQLPSLPHNASAPSSGATGCSTRCTKTATSPRRR